MSYPQLINSSYLKENCITFTIPNYRVIRKIEENTAYNKNIRMEIAAKLLLKKVDNLLLLFSHFKVNKSLVERNKIRVNLYMPPPPPYPPPIPIIIVGEPNYISIESALRVLSTNRLITNANNSINKNTLARYETDQPLNPPPLQS